MEKRIEKYQVSFFDDSREIAHITFPMIHQNVVNINHTYVNSFYRGKGLADQLMQEVVATIEKNHWHCICTCSYAKQWFVKHPEKQYLLIKKSTNQ